MHFSKILILVVLLNSRCFSEATESKSGRSPAGFDLAKSHKITLQDDMEEISGLQWVGEDQLWAIEDESSVIYSLDPQTGKILKKRKFAKNKDIEDLLELDDVAWVLQSNGTLYQVVSPMAKDVKSVEYPFPIKEKRDMEAIVASGKQPSLYVFCKVCQWDLGPQQASIFRFDLTTMSYDSLPFATLKRAEIQRFLPDKTAKPLDIQPSAAAFHPIEERYYIISSTGKWLLTTDRDFRPEEVYQLDPRIFKQPEGITFDPKGNMYISNEAQDGEPNLLIFDYIP